MIELTQPADLEILQQQIDQLYADVGINRARIVALEDRVAALEAEPPPIEPPIDPPPIDPPPSTGTILIDRKFDTQAQINAFHYVSGMQYPAGDPRAARYDSTIGGALIPILRGEQPSSLRKDSAWVLAPTTGRVYAQWDFYVPQTFYDLFDDPNLGWDSIKTFRLYNVQKHDIKEDNSGTLTMLPPDGQTWVRSAGTYATLDDGDEMVMHYRPPADTWVTHRITKDFDNLRLEFSARTGGNIIHSDSCAMEYLTPIDNIAALVHSTSRDTGATQPHDTFFGYRNLILGVE